MCILFAVPRYMKNRRPYKLKNFILFYNIIQILVNVWLVKEYISAGWFTEYGIFWDPLKSMSPNAIKVCFNNIIVIISYINNFLNLLQTIACQYL